MFDIQNQSEVVNNFMRFAAFQRGRIINDTIHLERRMDEFIARYFCPTDEAKKAQLMELILCTKRIIFENKFQIFLFIIKKTNPDYVIKFPPSDFEKIFSERNILAHYLLYNTEEAVKIWVDTKTIYFINFTNGIKSLPYDQDKFDLLHDRIVRYLTLIIKLLDTGSPSQDSK